MKQHESKRAALFGQSGASELDEAFAKSIGNMNDTIGDAEEMVYNQDKLLSDMDSLLMMQKVRTCLLHNRKYLCSIHLLLK